MSVEDVAPSRYHLMSELGEGGMGVVYIAYDRVRKMRVALKRLRRDDGRRIYRFKRAFRALNSLSHPNVVSLYDLVEERGVWFLAMELVEGVDFFTYIRYGAAPTGATTTAIDSVSHDTAMSATATTFSDIEVSPTLEEPAPALSPDERPVLQDSLDLVRFKNVLIQLACGLSALHQLGVIHCDLKPANVLVTAEERVVLMDFGIITELQRHEPGVNEAVGTPAFMAPEQVDAEHVDEAVDWYAFGVMIYMGLTRQLPFEGTAEAVLADKRRRDPQRPSAHVAGIPPELEALCMRLLARDASARPSGDEVLVCLGGQRAGTLPIVESARVFVGRAAPLTSLSEAYARAAGGQTLLVVVRGPAGIGKSALVDWFLSRLQALEVVSLPASSQAAVLSLAGSCHERESVPYRAFDGIVDALSLYLSALADDRRGPLLPADAGPLVRLFPVLRRVPEWRRIAAPTTSDARALRRRGLAALRSLFERICRDGRRVILRIEDLHWADRDSFALLGELLAPPALGALLIITTLRSEVAPESAAGVALPPLLATLYDREMACDVELGPLSEAEQLRLVERLAGPDASRVLAPRLITQAGGHPRLLVELARYGRAQAHELIGRDSVALSTVLQARVSQLPSVVRSLLEAVALAVEPTPLDVLAAAAGVPAIERERAATRLVSEYMARVSRSDSDTWLEAYHDEIRRAVLDTLSDECQRELHGNLALAMGERDDLPAARRGRHWLAAGDRSQAAVNLLGAGDISAAQLAFERAEGLYRQVLDLVDEKDQTAAQVQIRCRAYIGLAEALRIQDRSDEALDAVERAIELADAATLDRELAQVHYLRGNLLFPRGDLDGCLEEHQQARFFAQRAGSARLEAQALSGLGDAQYLRSRMQSGFQFYDRCIALCRAHELASLEAATLSMRGLTCFYQLDIEAAIRDGQDAVALARTHHDPRAEVVARIGCLVLYYAECERVETLFAECDTGREVAREIGAARFEANSWLFQGWGHYARGDVAVAAADFERALEAARRTLLSFVGPMALISLAWVTDDAGVRERAQRESMALIEGGALSHNLLYVYRYSAEIALRDGDAARAERYAEQLEELLRAEPHRFGMMIIERVRALARYVRGERGDDLLADIAGLRERADEAGLRRIARALERAHAGAAADALFLPPERPTSD